MMDVFLAIGLVMAGVVVVAAKSMLTVRIVVDQGAIVWTDWLGRERVRGSLAGAQLEELARNSGATKQFRIQTDAGMIKGYTSISDYGILKRVLRSEWSAGAMPPSTFSVTRSSDLQPFTPAARTYRYTWSPLHLFSFLWLAACLFMLGGFGMTLFGANRPSFGGAILFVGVLLLFIAIGVWMQLTAWVERITLDADAIEWVDCLGRIRVHATLDEIVGSDLTRGDGATFYQIFTTHGTIKASSYLRSSGELMAVVDRIVASRRGNAAAL